MAQRDAPDNFGDYQADNTHDEQEHDVPKRVEFLHQNLHGHIGDQQHRYREREIHSHESPKNLIRQTSNVEETVVTPQHALSPNRPKAHGCQHKHESVMDHNSHEGEREEAHHLEDCKMEPQLVRAVSHDRESRAGIDKAAEINLSEGQNETRVHG